MGILEKLTVEQRKVWEQAYKDAKALGLEDPAKEAWAALEFNPYHDAGGRFARASGASSVTIRTKGGKDVSKYGRAAGQKDLASQKAAKGAKVANEKPPAKQAAAGGGSVDAPPISKAYQAQHAQAAKAIDDSIAKLSPAEKKSLTDPDSPVWKKVVQDSIPENVRDTMELVSHDWMSGSGGDHALYAAHIVGQAFGGRDGNVQMAERAGRWFGQLPPEKQQDYKTAVLSTYALTQAHLSLAGQDKVSLFRGVQGEQAQAINGALKGGGKATLKMYNLTSYTTDKKVAEEFATSPGSKKVDGYVHTATTPRGAIFMGHTTPDGPGEPFRGSTFGYQREQVLLGKPVEVTK